MQEPDVLIFTFAFWLTCAQHRHQGRWGTAHRLAPGIWGRCICIVHIHKCRGRYRSARSWPRRWTCPWSSRRRCRCSWPHRCTSCTRSVHVLVKDRQTDRQTRFTTEVTINLMIVNLTNTSFLQSPPPQSLLLERSQLKLSHSQNVPL